MAQHHSQHLAFLLGLVASAGLALAQSDSQPRRPARNPVAGQPGDQRPGGPGRQPGGERPNRGAGARWDGGAILHAMDKDRDGSLSADEINRAATALKLLDGDNDGQITMEEMREYASKNVRPPAPPRGPGGGEPERERRRDEQPPAAPRDPEAKPPEGQRPRDPDARPREGQRPAGPGGPGQEGPRARMGDGGALLGTLDTDRDRTLSAAEIADASKALGALDTDKDGAVGVQELREAAARNAVRAMFNDANGDGTITRDELPERLRERFEEMDTNGDGHLDKGEQEAVQERLRQRRQQGEPGERPARQPPPAG